VADSGIEPRKPKPLEVAVIAGCTGSESAMRKPGGLFERAVMEVARRTAEQEGTLSFTCVGRNPSGSATFPVDAKPFSTTFNAPRRRVKDLDGQASELLPDVRRALAHTATKAGSRIDQMVQLGLEHVGSSGRNVVVIVSDGMSTDRRPRRFHAYRHPPMTRAQVDDALVAMGQAGELPRLVVDGKPVEVYFLGVRDGRNVLKSEGTAAVHEYLAKLVERGGGDLRALSQGIDLKGFGGEPAAATPNEEK
jgi:hypothetical protein